MMPLFTPDGDQRGVLIKIDDLDGATDEHKLSILFSVDNTGNVEDDGVSIITNHLVIDGHNIDIPEPSEEYTVKTEPESAPESLRDELPKQIIYEFSASDIVQAVEQLETAIRESNEQRTHVTFTVGIIVSASVLLGCFMIFLGGVLSSAIKRW